MSTSAGYAAMLSRRYALWGRDVPLTNPRDGTDLTLRMIDMTRGVEVGDGVVTVATVEPVAMVRKSEITAADLVSSDLINAAFTLNGVSWRVQSTQPRPSVHGPEGGEVMLMLARACD